MIFTNKIRRFAQQDLNMFLTRISIRNFKNIREADLSFSSKINCISGDNGAGKSNLLDAVYYLSMTKSFFSASDQFVYGYDADEATLCGQYSMEDGTEERIAASVRRGGDKLVKRGAKAYERFSDHIGLLPVVMVSPMDSALVNESGDERRKYMNFILSQTDKEYLRHIQAYGQLLMQRNKLLKSDVVPGDLLDVFADRMSPHAAYIFEARRRLAGQLQPMVKDFYSSLSPGRETVGLSYHSDLMECTLEEALMRDAEKERSLRHTTVGIQRDDLVFEMDSRPMRRCGSQGQQKSFLLAMKLAQFLFIKQIYGRTPILLLDDVFDKLDDNRVNNLLTVVSSLDFGQIFITDCSGSRLSSAAERLAAPCLDLRVSDGRVSVL